MRPGCVVKVDPCLRSPQEISQGAIGLTLGDCQLKEPHKALGIAIIRRRACSAAVTPTGGEALRLDGGREVVPRPGPGSIRAWCRSEDILVVIGRYVALDRRGVGRCPFKAHHYRGDVRPSFQVFGGVDPHWYCYAWRRAGDLFDFLYLYHQITPQEVWVRLREGTLW